MSKVIKSPVKRWPGTVTLSDPLTFSQVFAFEDAIKEIEGLPEEQRNRVPYIMVKGICPCVEKWDLEGLGEGVTPDTFPSTPRVSSAELIKWLIGEVTELFKEAEEVPLD